jgi:hypothetical protein
MFIVYEMGWACSLYGGEEAYTVYWCGNLRERDNLEDAGIDGRIILRWFFREWDVGFGLNRDGSR